MGQPGESSALPGNEPVLAVLAVELAPSTLTLSRSSFERTLIHLRRWGGARSPRACVCCGVVGCVCVCVCVCVCIMCVCVVWCW